MQYTQDYDEKLIPLYNTSTATFWGTNIQPYVKSSQILNCPSAPSVSATTLLTGQPAYGLNVIACAFNDGVALAAINNPAELILSTDNSYVGVNYPTSNPNDFGYYSLWYNANTSGPGLSGQGTNIGVPFSRHFDGTNTLFADGHVKWQKTTLLKTNPYDATTPGNWRMWYPTAP
jgi:prepilin-type processing-associated H-X9-DG protein